ncbi:uncharacterized protein LOC144798297 [Lissotriton helveticus]
MAALQKSGKACNQKHLVHVLQCEEAGKQPIRRESARERPYTVQSEAKPPKGPLQVHAGWAPPQNAPRFFTAPRCTEAARGELWPSDLVLRAWKKVHHQACFHCTDRHRLMLRRDHIITSPVDLHSLKNLPPVERAAKVDSSLRSPKDSEEHQHNAR